MIKPEQEEVFLTGNEAIVRAAQAIDFHLMAYYPITPSTEIAEGLDQLAAVGKSRVRLLAADGEHGAAGACFGASTGGARVLNATSANGLMYSLEQLPVQAGCRLPMVLNLVTRSISGPLNIRCDHSDLSFALGTGWIILCASTAQAAYDLNIIGLRLGEHPKVRLPVMIVSDGFFTSHQRQSLEVFSKPEIVQKFLGPRHDPHTSLDPAHPVTFGPYMNDPDLINNKIQLDQAHQSALEIYTELSEEYFQISNRRYPLVEEVGMQEATSALCLLNSSAEVAKSTVKEKIEQGEKIGLLKPILLRPFPSAAYSKLTESCRTLLVGDRSLLPGAPAGPLALDVQSALSQNGRLSTRVLNRIYGIGGMPFSEELAQEFIDSSRDTNSEFFKITGGRPGDQEHRLLSPPQPEPPATEEQLIQIEVNQEGRPQVQVAHPSEFTLKKKRISPGHGACPGCGIFSGLDQFFKGIEGNVVVLYHTGCAMVVTTGYPFTSHKVTYLHNLFQNGAPTLAGLVEVFKEKKLRSEIPSDEDITFVMITGDGGMDIGMGPTIGTALRNHQMIILEYDNQGYMNTGGQLSASTPQGHQTSTSHVGPEARGKSSTHKDSVQIMATTGIPYCFSAIENTDTDLLTKAAKAQWYAKNHGLAFGRILISCPPGWGCPEKMGQEILQLAADTCFFPIYEIEQGITKINYNPDQNGSRRPVEDWLKEMKKSSHLCTDEYQNDRLAFQTEVDRRWNRLLAMDQHPLL